MDERADPRGKGRRGDKRCELAGQVTVFHLGRVHGSYRLVDLSVGGARLRGDVPASRGQLYRVVIQLDRHHAPIRHAAFVVRCDKCGPAQWELGMAFLQPRALSVPQLVRRTGRVLLALQDARLRSAVGAALARDGYGVVEADDVREALWELENGPADYLVAAIGPKLVARGNLLGHARSHYPAVRCVPVEDPRPAAVLSSVRAAIDQGASQPLPPTST